MSKGVLFVVHVFDADEDFWFGQAFPTLKEAWSFVETDVLDDYDTWTRFEIRKEEIK